MAEESSRRQHDCRLDEEAVCMTLHPEGFPALKKSEYFAEKFREYRQIRNQLNPKSGKCGILLQSLLGHGRSGEQITTENWQRAVNINGDCGVGMRMCMLDSGFQSYIRDTIMLLAAAQPDFFMVDDDVRLINGKLVECFCPLHVEQFNKQFNTAHTSATLRQAILSNPVTSPEVINFEKMRQQTLLDFAKLIREAIDAVDPAIPCGYCTPGYEFLIAGDMARILAGGNAPFLRCNNALYAESDPRDLPRKMAWSAQFSKYYGTDIELLTEADTCPFNCYSKSAQSLHAQIAGGILNGIAGAKIWLDNVLAADLPTSRKYQTFIGGKIDFYHALETMVKKASAQGVISPGRFDVKKFHVLSPLECYSQSSWQRQVFNLSGIPSRCEKDNFNGIVALAGEDAADCFSDAELTILLHGKLLLDGSAALALAKRGFADALGVLPQNKAMRFHSELDLQNGENMMLIHHESMPFLEITSPRVEKLSSLILKDFYASNHFVEVAPGCTFYQNEWGGRVAVNALSLSPGNYIFNALTPVRRKFWLRLLNKLASDNLPLLAVDCDQSVWAMQFSAENCEYLAIFNLGFDPLETIELISCIKPVAISKLNDNGIFETLDWQTSENGNLSIACKLHCYEFCVLSLNAII